MTGKVATMMVQQKGPRESTIKQQICPKRTKKYMHLDVVHVCKPKQKHESHINSDPRFHGAPAAGASPCRPRQRREMRHCNHLLHYTHKH